MVEGDPQHKTTVHFNKGTLAGTWTSTPGKWHAFTERDEFCYIISGHCQLISSDGTVQDFGTGDAFLIPNGFRGFWNVIETTTKHFVIRDDAKGLFPNAGTAHIVAPITTLQQRRRVEGRAHGAYHRRRK